MKFGTQPRSGEIGNGTLMTQIWQINADFCFALPDRVGNDVSKQELWNEEKLRITARQEKLMTRGENYLHKIKSIPRFRMGLIITIK